MPEPLHFFASAPKGLEPYLRAELAAMGISEVKEARAGVAFRGSLRDAYRACLWSRIANRVLLPLRTFPAATPEKLYGGTKSIRWSDHVRAEGTLAVDLTSTRSQIAHTHFGALKVKDAIVDQLRSVKGQRPTIDVARPDVRVNVHLENDQATVSIDLSGESLHRRGYREQGVAAPLKENLAAGLLAMAEWAEAVATGRPLLDPMCGSGTLAIEAAWIAGRVAPGMLRDYFGFQGWLGHEPKLWEELRREAEEARVRDRRALPAIVGYDRDPRAVHAALANSERAGLRGWVHFEKRELSALQPVPGSDGGLLITNPPYGERLGEVEELKPLYKEISDVLKQRFSGWEAWILTSSPELVKAIRLQPSRRFVVFNGALECRLLKYSLFAGSGRK